MNEQALYEELSTTLVKGIKEIQGRGNEPADNDIVILQMSGKLHSWLKRLAAAGPVPEPEELPLNPGDATQLVTWYVRGLRPNDGQKVCMTGLWVAVMAVNDFHDPGDWKAALRVAGVRWLIENQKRLGLTDLELDRAMAYVVTHEPFETSAADGWAGAWLE